MPAWLQAAAADHAARRPCLLYAGPAGQDLPGYLPVPHAGPVPLADDTVDGIYIADSLERLAREPLLAKELHRVAKPGARMVLHPRRIGVQDMLALIGRAAVGAGGWRLAQVTFAADQRLEAGAGVDLAELVRRYPATLRGMLIHLRATKPGHDSAATEPSPPKIVFSNLDRWAGFSKVDK